MLSIDKDVPLPHTRGARRYPFAAMNLGDSLFFASSVEANNAANCAYVYGHRTEKKFSSRKVPGGRRIWRIA